MQLRKLQEEAVERRFGEEAGERRFAKDDLDRLREEAEVMVKKVAKEETAVLRDESRRF